MIWLTGVDYFSTLGYQPGIALLAAGVLSPIATALLVAVTLLARCPIYSQVAGRSFVGQGSIAMLENLLPGWWGKLLVLVLLGFAATDFVITMTLPPPTPRSTRRRIRTSIRFSATQNCRSRTRPARAAGGGLHAGFKEAIGLATAVAIPYLLLNVVVLVRTLYEIFSHPGRVAALAGCADATRRLDAASAGGGAALFPRLALGLSGFETGVSVMPLIRGEERPTTRQPVGRIRNTRKLLVTAALIMSVLLMAVQLRDHAADPGGSVSRPAVRPAGAPSPTWRTNILGNLFGTIYDISTILILWFAGASAMAGLLHLVLAICPASEWRPSGWPTPGLWCGAVRLRRADHLDLQGRCRGAGRRLRHRRPGADVICRHRGGDLLVAGALAAHCGVLRAGRRGVRVYNGR